MQLTPRYGTEPIITLDGPPSDILQPVVRQRRRLAGALEAFKEAQWQHPSRCAGWSNRDVIVHLNSTNSFWAFSIAAGLSGNPTTFLATFDPVASPAQLVAAAQELPASDVLATFVASSAALETALTQLSGDDWSTLAEAPPGHISISALAHHALWDSWVHERDVLLPLGIEPDLEADEVTAVLRYVAALAPGFALTRDSGATGTLSVATTDPHTEFLVEIGDHVHVRTGTGAAQVHLSGDAVGLVESLSVRAPLVQPIPAAYEWMLDGLRTVFGDE